MTSGEPASVSTPLARRLHHEIAAAGGWMPFDRYMAAALYDPEGGYYAGAGPIFGRMPGSGSDFVTAPELSPLFGRALGVQLAQAMAATGSREVWEFGAGSGALAATLIEALEALGSGVERYSIVELSASLSARQRSRLASHGARVRWVDRLPEAFSGVVVGNELLDAMPVQLLHRQHGGWRERGVASAGDRFVWADRPTSLRPPTDGPFDDGYVTEIHPQAEAFVRTLAARMRRGAAFFIDYGFPEAEYYHPQRCRGTLVAHRAHRVEWGDDDPLADPGSKDLSAHVDFTGIALAGQDAGLSVIGYASQGRFLVDCGIAELLRDADARSAIAAQPLIAEHEMGELFKVIGFSTADVRFDALGFSTGDRSHRL